MLEGLTPVVVVGMVVFAWAIFLDVRFRHETRLARWWVRRSRRWAAPLAFAVSTGLLVAYGVLAAVGHQVGEAAGHPAWAMALDLPVMLVYAPYVFTTMPTQFGGYQTWREQLEQEGADRSLQRRIAWAGGLPSILGLVAMIATLFSVFEP